MLAATLGFSRHIQSAIYGAKKFRNPIVIRHALGYTPSARNPIKSRTYPHTYFLYTKLTYICSVWPAGADSPPSCIVYARDCLHANNASVFTYLFACARALVAYNRFLHDGTPYAREVFRIHIYPFNDLCAQRQSERGVSAAVDLLSCCSAQSTCRLHIIRMNLQDHVHTTTNSQNTNFHAHTRTLTHTLTIYEFNA